MPQHTRQEQARRELARREAIRRGLINEDGTPAREPRPGRLDLAGRSALGGIPIVGPLLTGAVDHGRAAVEAFKSGKPFHKELKALRKDFEVLEERHPNINWVSELAGSIAGFAGLAATPQGAVALGVRGGSLAVRAIKGAVTTGAITGADVAAREGEASPMDAAIGALFGAAGPVAGHALGRGAARLRGQKKPLHREGEVAEGFRKQADTLYEATRQAGLVIEGRSFGRLADSLEKIARDEGYQRALHPRISMALREFSKTKRAVKPTTRRKAGKDVRWQDLEGLRRGLGRIARSPVDEERFIAAQMSRQLDEFTAGLKPADVVAGDLASALPSLREARSLSHQAFKSDILDEAINKARSDPERSIGPALRAQFNRVLNNKKLIRQFSKEERELIDRVSTQSGGEKVLSVVGDLRSMIAGGAVSFGLGMAGAGATATGLPGVVAGTGLLGARALYQITLVRTGGPSRADRWS